MEEQHDISLGEFVERHRFLIGGILLLAVILSTALLLFRENYAKVRAGGKAEQLEIRITKLENELFSIKREQEVLSANNQKQDDVQVEQTSLSSVAPSEPSTKESGSVKGQSVKAPAPLKTGTPITGTVNINTASASQLDALPGIGPTYAQRIIEYREANGSFGSVEEVMKVKGIGPKTFEKFKNLIAVQ